MAIVPLEFTGTRDECDAYVAQQKATYAPGGYGTWFNWPPGLPAGGKPVTHRAPTDHGGGRWTVRGSRSTSCD